MDLSRIYTNSFKQESAMSILYNLRDGKKKVVCTYISKYLLIHKLTKIYSVNMDFEVIGYSLC